MDNSKSLSIHAIVSIQQNIRLYCLILRAAVRMCTNVLSHSSTLISLPPPRVLEPGATSLITSDFQSRPLLFLLSFFNSALPAQRISTYSLRRIVCKMLHHIIRGRLFRVRKPTNGSMDSLRACMRVAMLALILIFRCGELTSSLGMVQEAGR